MSSSPLFSDYLVPPRRPASSFIPWHESALLGRLAAIPKLTGVKPASRLGVRPAPELAATGIFELDALIGGLPRGCLSEICGPPSSGRTSVMLATLAAATKRGEFCALIDTSDAFNPDSAATTSMEFERLLWIRCGERRDWKKSGNSKTAAVEQALRVLDLLLQAGGFGVVAIDFSDVPFQIARRVPLASWFRFQRALEPTSTILLVIAQAPCAQTCASLVLRLQSRQNLPGLGLPAHSRIFEGMQVEGELLRSRLMRKPAQSAHASFKTQAVRAG
jgi:recA bacterial DNA recombination protein